MTYILLDSKSFRLDEKNFHKIKDATKNNYTLRNLKLI